MLHCYFYSHNFIINVSVSQAAAHARFTTSDPKWHVTSAVEMMSFFAINMVMGINIKPEYRDYWRGDEVLRDSYVSAIMTRL